MEPTGQNQRQRYIWSSSPGHGTGGEVYYPDYLIVFQANVSSSSINFFSKKSPSFAGNKQKRREYFVAGY